MLNRNQTLQLLFDIVESNNLDGGFDVGGTDKFTYHAYEEIYGDVMSKYYGFTGNLLEIGAYSGGSALLWRNFLPNFKLEIVDIETHRITPERLAQLYNTNIKQADAYTGIVLQEYAMLYPEGFDIIIEDGPHTLDTQMFAAHYYSNLLSSAGTMVIEDIASIDHMLAIIREVPQGFKCTSYDLRHIKNRFDDIVLVITRL
jgi:hypothetical protein